MNQKQYEIFLDYLEKPENKIPYLKKAIKEHEELIEKMQGDLIRINGSKITGNYTMSMINKQIRLMKLKQDELYMFKQSAIFPQCIVTNTNDEKNTPKLCHDSLEVEGYIFKKLGNEKEYETYREDYIVTNENDIVLDSLLNDEDSSNQELIEHWKKQGVRHEFCMLAIQTRDYFRTLPAMLTHQSHQILHDEMKKANF